MAAPASMNGNISMKPRLMAGLLLLLVASQVQAYYNATTGRWLSRDPVETLNVHCFVMNNSLATYDFMGLWGKSVHYAKTKDWAVNDLKMPSNGGEKIAWEDNNTDKVYDPFWFSEKSWSWHFDRSNGGRDSRLEHAAMQLLLAKLYCSGSADNWGSAATALGRGLHALQDWVAHGDFNRRKEAPHIAEVGAGNLLLKYDYAHNKFTPIAGQSWQTVDDPAFDARGLDGRATIDVLKFARTTSVGDKLYWTTFHPGSQRIKLTESKSKEMLKNFLTYVANSAKPCGECRAAFLSSEQE